MPLRSVLLLFAAALIAAAQTPTFPFSIRVQQGTDVQTVSDGATILFEAPAIGLPKDAAVTITYLGAGAAQVAINGVEYSGSTDFSVSNVPAELPLTLTARQPTTGVNIRFQPTASDRKTGRLTVRFAELNQRPSSFTLNLAGVAPEFGFTYMVQPNGNTALLNNGGTIAFPPSTVDETVTAIVTAANRGTGPGTIRSFASTGDRFELAQLPFPPATVQPNTNLRFAVRFTPKELNPVTGTVRVELPERMVNFNVTGSGTGPVYAYDVIAADGVSSLLPNQTLTVPDAIVGEESSTVVRVRNAGNADARIAAINVSGAGFSLTEAPFVPLTLTPGSAITLRVNFKPTQPGRQAGRLRVGDDNFDVAANGLGANLVFAYASGSATFNVNNNGTVVFPPAAVGATSDVRFTLTNNGTAPTSINSISVTGSTVFTTSDVPATPLTIEPGAGVSFNVTFTPTTVGAATAVLRVDTQTFTLSAVGNQPVALPGYQFEGATGTVEPVAQPSIGLRLDRSYPLALNGTFTLSFNSEVFASDPAVQFATGGRTVNFTIPAGQTQALFPNNRNQIALQTGTVAGAITVTPAFATTEGNINLTPATPPALNLNVTQSAPRLLSVQVGAKTASGFTLLITGYATGRSITQMDLQFTAVSGENVATTRLSLPVEASFTAWYGSAQSQPFGSLFTASVPFTMQGEVTNVTNVVDTIQSVQVTISNRQGASQARSVDLR
jgi:hypothetical protein